MGYSIAWKDAPHHGLIEEVPVESFQAIINTMSIWMEEETSPETIVGTLMRVIHADMSVPVVLGAHGEVLYGLPQVLRAYLEGYEVVRAMSLELTPQPHGQPCTSEPRRTEDMH